VLVDAARRLANASENFTTQDLAKEAGVSVQTFYRHFASKDELVLAVLEETTTELCAAFELAEPTTDPVARLRILITGVFEPLAGGEPTVRFLAADYWRLIKLFPDEMDGVVKPYVDLLAGTIEKGCAAGVFSSPDVQRDAWLILQMVSSVYHQATARPGVEHALGEDVWNWCLRVLSPGTIDGAR
jgi:TetR/AcrR family transcriptional regulator